MTGASVGDKASGWMFMNADKPANIREQDSETTWLTSEAIRFIDQATDSWCAHVSYIKPHWPFIVPAPYHDMYNSSHIQPVVRDEAEKINPLASRTLTYSMSGLIRSSSLKASSDARS